MATTIDGPWASGPADDGEDWARRVFDPGGWLVDHLVGLERAEAVWLSVLGYFDAEERWAADGMVSCVDWLAWRAKMTRGTAYEKVRVARELRHRPVVAAAFEAGEISYSAVRAITRLDDPDPEVDAALVELAKAGTVADLERMVRIYELHADQERPPAELDARRGLRLSKRGDGLVRVELIVSDVEAAELEAAVVAFMERSDDSSADDSSAEEDGSDSSAEKSSGRGWGWRRADALMDAVRTGLAHACDGHPTGGDRYVVHVVRGADGGGELVDGVPVDAATAGRVSCDCSIVEHQVGAGGEPLRLGRKTKVWNTAQRRAILVRDGGRCRFPGCERQVVDIHHVRSWHPDGPTDVENGILCCPRHHTLLHDGFRAIGNANETVTFYRRDGTVIASSSPQRG